MLEAVEATTGRALSSGALRPLSTEPHVVEDHGLAFVVYVLSSLQEKERRGDAADERRNPFLPHEEEMFVGWYADHYKVLLNKFPVTMGHVLLCTKELELQTDPLSQRDIAAAWALLNDLSTESRNYLAFYNFGDFSGRSQFHKHLQVIPLPIHESACGDTPIDQLVQDTTEIFEIQQFQFKHAICSISSRKPPLDLFRLYGDLLKYLKVPLASADEGLSYNWVLTKSFMMIVPRGAEKCQGISVNSLGFVGSILVKDVSHLETVSGLGGPLALLKAVAVDRD